jgi:hypothetical protein
MSKLDCQRRSVKWISESWGSGSQTIRSGAQHTSVTVPLTTPEMAAAVMMPNEVSIEVMPAVRRHNRLTARTTNQYARTYSI